MLPDDFDVNVPEFRFPVNMKQLNEILPPEIQACIVHAALAEWAGALGTARRCRAAAGYE